jgi:hypothetical protein
MQHKKKGFVHTQIDIESLKGEKMAWPWKILLFQFCVTMGLAVVFYVIWRLTHRGQKW